MTTKTYPLSAIQDKEEMTTKTEPIAYALIDKSGRVITATLKPNEVFMDKQWIPLYTAPPHRTLSDEEICEIGQNVRAVEGNNFLPVTFARAILEAAR